ncbi:MAG: uroporphyrinogen-III C-methyltransferase [Polyangiales bacterium]
MEGSVVFVAAGCGDPDLITVRGRDRIEEADVVARGAFPADKGLVESMVAQARAGARVVRVIEGDPLLDCAAEIAEVARAGVPIEIVPGVPLAIVAAAHAGIPTDSSALIADIESGALAAVAKSLLDDGVDPQRRAALIGWPKRRSAKTIVSALGTLAEHVVRAGLGDEGTLVVSASRSDEPARFVIPRWFESLPLYGLRVLITRASAQAQGTAKALRMRGAVPLEFPTIVVSPPHDPAPLAEAVKSLARYDAIALTSANGVDAFFAALDSASLDARAIGRALVATIGPGTEKALRRYGVRADLVADEHRGEALASALLQALAARGTHSPMRVLLPRAEVARDALPETLRAASVPVDVVTAYRTSVPPKERAIELQHAFATRAVDAVLFTASSTVDHFCALLPDAKERLAEIVVASIGPITTEACKRRGVQVDVEANPYTIPSLIKALERLAIAGGFGDSLSTP